MSNDNINNMSITPKRQQQLERLALQEVLVLTGRTGPVKMAPPSVDDLSPPSQAAYRIRVAELTRAEESGTPAPSTEGLQERGIEAYARNKASALVKEWTDHPAIPVKVTVKDKVIEGLASTVYVIEVEGHPPTGMQFVDEVHDEDKRGLILELTSEFFPIKAAEYLARGEDLFRAAVSHKVMLVHIMKNTALKALPTVV